MIIRRSNDRIVLGWVLLLWIRSKVAVALPPPHSPLGNMHLDPFPSEE